MRRKLASGCASDGRVPSSEISTTLGGAAPAAKARASASEATRPARRRMGGDSTGSAPRLASVSSVRAPLGEPHRKPPRAPASWVRLEDARARRLAAPAAAARIERPVREHVPVATDQPRAAGVAVGALTLEVVDVAGVDVSDPAPARDRAGALERRRRGPRLVAQPIVGMEG